MRDREVRAHEQAHMAAAGAYSRGGPDNRQYAVGGEVQIDTSAVSGDPEATIRKAQTVRRAANAPATPHRRTVAWHRPPLKWKPKPDGN